MKIMHSWKKKVFPTFVALATGILVARPASAHSIGLPYWPSKSNPIVPCSALGTGGRPACTSWCDLIHLAQHVIYFLLTLAIFIVGPFMIGVGGIMLMISAGAPERMAQGKKVLTGAVIGMLIGLFSYLIVGTIFFLIG
ncbi:hypothetical protein D6779_05685, partial [Candidatus Parcubacteria bacterium]